MAIELICKGCSRKLRIADENAGKLARCPSCGETFTVPAATGPSFGGLATTLPGTSYSPGPLPSATSDRWYLKTEDGSTYGPVPRAELDSWASEGRMTSASQVLREGETIWQPAQQLYPFLSAEPKPAYSAPSAPAKNPFADPSPAPSQNPYASPQTPGPAVRTGSGLIGGVYVQPHRGGVILTLGILGLCFCQFLGIAAVVMASQDLKLMNEGRMDASGKGLTTAGMVLGVISIVIFVLWIFVNIAGGFR